MSIVRFDLTIPGGDHAIDFFAESGLDCITAIDLKAVGLTSGTITLGAVSHWGGLATAKELTPAKPTLRLDGGCWSKAESNSESTQTINTSNLTTVKAEVYGLIDDCWPPPCSSSSSCPGSSSSSP